MQEPFALPDNIQIDGLSGLAINVPLNYQNYPDWWKDPENKETFDRIMATRESLGIVVEGEDLS